MQKGTASGYTQLSPDIPPDEAAQDRVMRTKSIPHNESSNSYAGPRRKKQRKQRATSYKNDLGQQEPNGEIGVCEHQGVTEAPRKLPVAGSTTETTSLTAPSQRQRQASEKSLQEVVEALPPTARLKRGYPRRMSFPEKLMEVISLGNHLDCICWLPDGEGFVFNPERMANEVIPLHFGRTKFDSFTRKLNRWGFRRYCSLEAPENTFVYAHRYFKRDAPELCSKMTGTKQPSSTEFNGKTSQSRQRLMPLYPGTAATFPEKAEEPRKVVNCVSVLKEDEPTEPAEQTGYVDGQGLQGFRIVTHQQPEDQTHQGKFLSVRPDMDNLSVSEGLALGTNMAHEKGAMLRTMLQDRQVLQHGHGATQLTPLSTAPSGAVIGATSNLRAAIAIHQVALETPKLAKLVAPSSEIVIGPSYEQALRHRDLLVQREMLYQQERARARTVGGLANVHNGIHQSPPIGAASLPAVVVPPHQAVMDYATIDPVTGLVRVHPASQLQSHGIGSVAKEIARQSTTESPLGSSPLEHRLKTPQHQVAAADILTLARAEQQRHAQLERELLHHGDRLNTPQHQAATDIQNRAEEKRHAQLERELFHHAV